MTGLGRPPPTFSENNSLSLQENHLNYVRNHVARGIRITTGGSRPQPRLTSPQNSSAVAVEYTPFARCQGASEFYESVSASGIKLVFRHTPEPAGAGVSYLWS